MAEAPVASDCRPRADGDVARRPDLRSSFAMANWRQRDGPVVILRNRLRIGRIASGRADRRTGLEWHQERKAGVENRFVSYDAQSRGRVIVRG